MLQEQKVRKVRKVFTGHLVTLATNFYSGSQVFLFTLGVYLVETL